jgi:dienelactone hydrolase
MKKLILAAIGLLSASSAFAVAPLIGDVADQNIAQGTSTGTLFFVVGDAETTFTSLTVGAVSSNPTLLPTLTLGGTNAQRSIAVTAASGLTGTATVTLTVTDGEALTASSSFTVVVTAANTRPTLTALQGFQIVSPGQTPAAVSFTVGDAETAAGSLSVVATSSNTGLVSNANLMLGGSGGSRTVQVSPVAGQKGSAVIRLRVSDALGARAEGEFIFSVFDAASTNNGFKQPRGIYLLDSTAGSMINGVRMRDGNIRDRPFVDGYVLRTEWATLEPTDGVFDFTIITNILAKLPAGQKLSLMVASGFLPNWLNTLPGVTTYTAGSPATTLPIPWDVTTQARHRQMLIALSNHLVDGVPLRDHPRLAAMDVWIPGLKSGIRFQTAQIRDIPGYTRALFEGGVLTHLANVTDAFPNVPAMIGFWSYTDSIASPTAWESLRLAILAQHNGITRPHVGFWMENLAANRSAADADPWVGLPTFGFTAPLYNSQDSTPVCYQVLGSWSRPFAPDHVDNNLNGSPEDGMDYGFSGFQCRYYEHYQADVDFAGYHAEFQRWHDFLAALPAAPANHPGTLALNNNAYSIVENGGSATITVTRTGGAFGPVSVNYATSNGSATAGSDYTAASGTLSWADGDSASKTFTIPILNDGAREPNETVTLTLSNATGSATLGTAVATLTLTNDDPAFTLAVSSGGTSISGTSGTALTSTLSASGGTGPYSWSVISGTLSAGVTLNSDGTLTGTPSNTGTFTITAQATDANGNSDTQTFTITVSSGSQAVFNVTPTRNADGSYTLGWPCAIGSWYQVEFSNDLITWTLLGNSIQATTPAMAWTDNGTQIGTHPSTQPKRFYRVRNWGNFTVSYSGNAFTYTDAQRTVTGIFIKPTGTGPFPALIINHGTSGTAGGFGLQRANEMSPWGLACIAANLTHMAGATQDNNTWGYSPENLARIRACQAVLSTRSDVNVNQLAMWGHSRGAFAAIGAASDFGSELKALGFTAGGIHETADLSEPSAAEASDITAPTIMFHGSTDTIVPPADSLLLQTLLNSLGVINTRILYDTTGITPTNNAHNIQNTPFYTAASTGILAQWQAWLIARGVLP